MLITNDGIGGAERITILFAKILLKAGFVVKLLLLTKNTRNCVLKDFIPDRMDYELCAKNLKGLTLHLPQHIIRYKPDIVFSCFPYQLVILFVLKCIRVAKFKLVARCMNMPNKVTTQQHILYKYVLKHCDVVISQTQEMKEQMKTAFHLDDKIVVINNPIDKLYIKEHIEETFAFDHECTNYVAVGRVTPQKDLLMLMESFALVLQERPQSKLYIVGAYSENAYYHKLKAVITQKHIEEKVLFEGFQSNPYKYINGADVFCLSSQFEGLPNVMLDAMYLGKPVVATRCIPYIAQKVKEGENGYTVEVGDALAFSKAMCKATLLSGLPKFLDINNSETLVASTFSNCQ